ncbi:MAG: LCP family protein [Acidibacillus sp.]|nr:LCP family protein [Acidibacillus sp.]
MTPNQAAPMTVAGVEHFTGMPITDWVVTDFQGFSDAIDAVGGVHVWIPGRIYDPLHSGANLYPGWQTLTGSQALAYIRVRQNTASNVATNDFSRDDAQAQVLAALQQKLLNKQNDVSHLGSLIHTWNQDVVTNLSVDDLLKIAQVVKGSTIIHVNLASVGDSMDVMSASFPGINQQDALTGAFYDIVDARVVTRTLQPYGSKGAWTGIALPTPSSIPVIVYASEAYVSELKASGYPVTDGNQVSGRNPVLIDYPPGHLAWGLQVGRTLATGNSIVQPGTSSQAVVVYGP